VGAFEKWIVFNGTIQNVLLLGTVLFAAYIGFKQTDIASKQTQISEQLLNLEYELSVALEWQAADQKLILHNQGKHNIYIGGTNLIGIEKQVYNPPRLIAVGSSHYIQTANLDTVVPPAQGRFALDVDIYLLDERRLKYVMHSHIILDKTKGTLNVAIQPSGTERSDWPVDHTD
jgi:hypothetical protein